jgi:hypothetical protein
MKKNDFGGGRRSLGLIIGGSIIALTALYGVFAALPFLMGPDVSIKAQTDENGLTRIYGKTERVSFLSIDGAEIALTEDGGFSVERAYPAGYTWLQAEAKDRFGRTITKTLTFVVSTTTHAQN